jgi:hypothetical protein
MRPVRALWRIGSRYFGVFSGTYTRTAATYRARNAGSHSSMYYLYY